MLCSRTKGKRRLGTCTFPLLAHRQRLLASTDTPDTDSAGQASLNHACCTRHAGCAGRHLAKPAHEGQARKLHRVSSIHHRLLTCICLATCLQCGGGHRHAHAHASIQCLAECAHQPSHVVCRVRAAAVCQSWSAAASPGSSLWRTLHLVLDCGAGSPSLLTWCRKVAPSVRHMAIRCQHVSCEVLSRCHNECPEQSAGWYD